MSEASSLLLEKIKPENEKLCLKVQKNGERCKSATPAFSLCGKHRNFQEKSAVVNLFFIIGKGETIFCNFYVDEESVDAVYTISDSLKIEAQLKEKAMKTLEEEITMLRQQEKEQEEIYKKSEGPEEKKLRAKINDLGIQFEKKFGDTTMNGNNCSKFLRHYSDVLADVPEEISSKYDHLFCLLEASKDLLFRKTCFEILDEEHISCCCMFEELMIEFLGGCFLTKNPFPSITFSLSMPQSLSKNGYQLECFPNKQSKVCMPLATK